MPISISGADAAARRDFMPLDAIAAGDDAARPGVGGREIAGCLMAGALPEAGIGGFLALPAPAYATSPAPLRHVACFALLRLADATLWLLRTRGLPWTRERLEAAARTLHRERSARRDTAYLAGRLAYDLEIAPVDVLTPVLHADAAEPWELRRTAIAVVMRALRTRGGQVDPAELAALTRQVEDGLRAALASALADFRAGNDAEAVREATSTSGGFDLALYNFLVEAPHRAWRLQLARTFPLFLRAAATGAAGSAGETIRSAVDGGLPLLRHLAGRWGVGASALRHLQHKDAALVGDHWEDNVRALAQLLDALVPEDRPACAAEWQQFNRAVAAGERIFRAPASSSALVRMWLRAAARGRWAGLDGDEAQGPWGPAAIAAALRLRDGLARYLELEAARGGAAPGVVRAASESVADHCIATRRPGRVREIADRFDRHRQNPGADLVREVEFLSGERFWPLLPGDHVAVNGTCAVAPLTSRAALRQHGAAMSNCLADRFLDDFAGDCAAARCFIVGVVDRTTGAPASTAEIRLARLPRGGGLEPQVVQHTGFANAAPSPRCRQALAEALAAVRAAAGQQHLEAGLRAIRQFRLLGRTKARDEAERLLLAEALGATLRPAVLAEMVATVRARCEADRKFTVKDGA